MTNKDIDIREHAVIIKWDRGHEEVKTISSEEGENVNGEKIRIVKQLDKKGKIVRIKVQNI